MEIREFLKINNYQKIRAKEQFKQARRNYNWKFE